MLILLHERAGEPIVVRCRMVAIGHPHIFIAGRKTGRLQPHSSRLLFWYRRRV